MSPIFVVERVRTYRLEHVMITHDLNMIFYQLKLYLISHNENFMKSLLH